MASILDKWGADFVNRHVGGRRLGLPLAPLPAWVVASPQNQNISRGPNTGSGNAGRAVRMPGIFDKAR